MPTSCTSPVPPWLRCFSHGCCENLTSSNITATRPSVPTASFSNNPKRAFAPAIFKPVAIANASTASPQELSWLRSVSKVLLNIPRHFLAVRCAANIAVSQHVAKRIALPRTTVIYHGVGSRFRQATPTASDRRSKIRNDPIRLRWPFRPRKRHPHPARRNAATSTRPPGLRNHSDRRGPVRPKLKMQFAVTTQTTSSTSQGFSTPKN